MVNYLSALFSIINFEFYKNDRKVEISFKICYKIFHHTLAI